MAEQLDHLTSAIDKAQEQSMKVVEQIFSASQPGAVFGEPVKSGEYIVITATEVGAGGGFGYGHGIGPNQGGPTAATAGQQQSGGGAGGGGGGSMGRPVAIIVIGPNGVEIKPIVDATKLGLAGITTGVAMLATIRKLFG